MILIEIGSNLFVLGMCCLIAIIGWKVLDFIKFLYLKDKYPDYNTEESETYVS